MTEIHPSIFFGLGIIAGIIWIFPMYHYGYGKGLDYCQKQLKRIEDNLK